MSKTAINHTQVSDGFELADFIAFIWQKKWRITLSVILLTSLGYMYVKSKPKVYSATSTILLDEKIRYQSLSGFEPFAGNKGEQLDTFIEFMRSRQFIQKVIEKMRLHESTEFKRVRADGQKVIDIQSAISVFIGNLKISKITNTEMLKVTFESQVAHTAAAVVNEIGPIFFKYQGQNRKSKASETTRWLDGQLSELKRELDAAENALEVFMSENGLINLENQVELSKTEIEKLIDHKLQLDKSLAIEKSYIQQINAAGSDVEKLMQIPVVLQDPLLRSLAANLFEKKLILEDLSKRYKYKHHKHIAATSAVDTIQAKFDESLVQVLDGIKQTYESTKQRQKALTAELDKVRLQHMKLSEHDIELATLQRQVSAKLKLYEVFVSRLQEMEIQKDLDEESEFAVVDYAQIPELPAKPKVLLGVIFIFVLSSIISVGFWLFVHLVMDKKNRLKQTLRKHNVRVLAEIPKPPKLRNKNNTGKTKVSKNELLYAEAVRSLRAELMVQSNNMPSKTLAFTHVTESKYSSRLIIDLAKSFAHIDKSMLIDGNLRDPQIGKAFGMEPLALGLTNFLARKMPFSQTKYQEKGSQLSVMPSGPIPGDPLLYFTKPKFAAFMQKLATAFERTIIDTPDVSNFNDVLVIAKSVDAIILLCDLETTESPDLLEAVQRILNSGTPLQGVVFTRAKNIRNKTMYKSGSNNYKTSKVLN